MQDCILQYVKQNQMIDAGDCIVVGVSGGADSVCLFHVLQQLSKRVSFTMAVLHVNHGLRGDNADADEEFTEQLAKQYNVPYKSFSIDVKARAKQDGMSIEEAGRVVRREAFEQFARECGANKIALGHHQDDQAETVIFNLVRGSGINGLCGMYPVRGQYIRPLLGVSKEEIEQYLTEHNLSWRVDESNLTEDYSRNKIRHKVIKYLEEINSQASEHIATMAKRLQEVEEYLAPQVDDIYNHFVAEEEDGLFIDEALSMEDAVMQKLTMRKAVQKAIGSLKDLSKENIESMATIFDKKVGKKIEIGQGFVLQRTYDGAVLKIAKPEGDNLQGEVVTVPMSGVCSFDGEQFSCYVVEAKGEPIEEKKYTKWLDYDKIKDNIVLRNRQHGDMIVTCQSGGKKKLKDYFIDAKIPREKRDELLLLAAGSDILWIVGKRISEKYKVTSDTKQILVITKKERNHYE